jgi:hypothetical protein
MLGVGVGQPATSLHPETADAVARVIPGAVVGGFDAEDPGEHTTHRIVST